MSARVPFATPFEHLVYVRVFEGCNLHCQHCFIPSNPKRMSLEDMAQIPDHVRKFARAGDRILLQWHGGEPTMFGAQWLNDAITTVEKSGPEFVWSHGIQTNLMTYSADWAQVYRDHFNGQVGVSWDPVIRLLRRDRPETNAEYESKFWPKLDQLISDGLEPYLVMTATKPFFARFSNPIRLFDMLEERGVRRGHIERLTETGYARGNWSWLGMSNAEYSHSMARMLRAYHRWHETGNGERKLRLSPFDGLMDSVCGLIAGESMGYGCWSGKCDTAFHTIDGFGYKRGCTALTSETDNSRANRNQALHIEDFEASRKERRIVDCTTCQFRTICSSGCLALSMDDGSGECSGGRGLFDAAHALATMEI